MANSTQKNNLLTSDQTKDRFIEVLAYLATSSRGLVYEPKLYGPLRLLEAANRLIDLMHFLQMDDEELRDVANKITNEAMLLSTNTEFCIKLTDELSLLFAKKLKR